MQDTTTSQRIQLSQVTAPVQGHILLMALATMPGILCHQMLAHHTPWYVIVPYVAFFTYMGLPPTVSLCKKWMSK